MSDLYQEIILETIKNPSNQGTLEDVEPIHERNASCGDEVTVFLKVGAYGKIEDVKWQGEGCAISMASMSLLSDKIIDEGLSIADVEQLSQEDLVEMLGLEQISPGRIKCLHLGKKAVSHAGDTL